MSEQSTLAIIGHFNQARARLRERAERNGYDIGCEGLCMVCDAKLTETDLGYGACTQCDVPIEREGDDE